MWIHTHTHTECHVKIAKDGCKQQKLGENGKESPSEFPEETALFDSLMWSQEDLMHKASLECMVKPYLKKQVNTFSFRVKSQMSLFSAHRTVVADTDTWHKRSTREAHFKHHRLLFPQGPVSYLVLFPPNDLCWDLDLVHVLMQRVSGFLADDFQKHLWGKKHIVSGYRVYTGTTTARDSAGPDHSMDRGFTNYKAVSH